MLEDPSFMKRLKDTLFGTTGGLSMLRPIGTGIATENKLLSSKECWFHVMELYPFDQNELKSDNDEIRDVGIDAKGESYEVSVKFGKSIKAEWLPSGGNRMTAPDIRRGERAEIFRLADTDKFYWRAMEMDQGVRRLETVVMMYSNTQNEDVKELSPENSWVVEISTHQKTMSIVTPKSDGEAFGYTVQLNTKDSTFVLQDDGGQSFELASNERFWRMVNADGTSVTIDKKNVTWEVPETFLLKCKDMIVEAGNSIKTKTNTHESISQEYSLSTNSYNNTSSDYKVSTGSLTISYGDGSFTGSTNFGGKLTNNGVNVGSSHKHSGVRGGDSSTAGPF